MAEGWARASAAQLSDPDAFSFSSAGLEAHGLNPRAVAVMAQNGIDISAHTSKHLDEFLQREVHTVITVCGNADQACPIFPGQAEKHHWPFDDPAKATGIEEEIRAVFRRVRDEIRAKFEAYAAEIPG